MNVLLKTKLYIPPARSGIVSRPRLTQRLNESLSHKLTLVSAPAGFGKTTLLSEWIGGCGPIRAFLAKAWGVGCGEAGHSFSRNSNNA